MKGSVGADGVLRVPGHGLQREGIPFGDDGEPWPHLTEDLLRSWLGRGLCSCGAMSEELPSNQQRKAWHRQHKAEVAGL